jgi:hypothetical protein
VDVLGGLPMRGPTSGRIRAPNGPHGARQLRQKIYVKLKSTPNVSACDVRWPGRCCRWLDALGAGQRGRPRLSRMAGPPTTPPARAARSHPAPPHRSLSPAGHSHVPPPAVDKRRTADERHDHSRPLPSRPFPFRILSVTRQVFFAVFLFFISGVIGGSP